MKGNPDQLIEKPPIFVQEPTEKNPRRRKQGVPVSRCKGKMLEGGIGWSDSHTGGNVRSSYL